MNHILVTFARQWLKQNLVFCTTEQNVIFLRMYSHNDLDRSMEDVVDAMPADKLSWAMEQVERTLKKNGINVIS